MLLRNPSHSNPKCNIVTNLYNASHSNMESSSSSTITTSSDIIATSSNSINVNNKNSSYIANTDLFFIHLEKVVYTLFWECILPFSTYSFLSRYFLTNGHDDDDDDDDDDISSPSSTRKGKRRKRRLKLVQRKYKQLEILLYTFQTNIFQFWKKIFVSNNDDDDKNNEEDISSRGKIIPKFCSIKTFLSSSIIVAALGYSLLRPSLSSLSSPPLGGYYYYQQDLGRGAGSSNGRTIYYNAGYAGGGSNIWRYLFYYPLFLSLFLDNDIDNDHDDGDGKNDDEKKQ